MRKTFLCITGLLTASLSTVFGGIAIMQFVLMISANAKETVNKVNIFHNFGYSDVYAALLLIATPILYLIYWGALIDVEK